MGILLKLMKKILLKRSDVGSHFADVLLRKLVEVVIWTSLG